ncbi:MAG: DUF488 family protein [Nitrospirota bacterium]|jgi:uncharacterized protein YeaO (DUF488 family)
MTGPGVKRVYDEPARSDGFRVLVDRLWPRGLSKEEAAVDLWLKDIAPSNELRKWYGHDPEKWPEFKRRYFGELKKKEELLEQITSRKGGVTLLFGSKEEKLNNAAALKEYIEKKKG